MHNYVNNDYVQYALGSHQISFLISLIFKRVENWNIIFLWAANATLTTTKNCKSFNDLT